MKVINLRNITSLNEVALERQVYLMRLYYSPVSERWAMDIESKTTGEKVNGLVMNTGEDVLSSSGRLGLQVLVPLGLPDANLEATRKQFTNEVKLFYMTLQEYNDFRYDGEATMRLTWP